MQLFLNCLLYFTWFGAIFALFASVLLIVMWLLKTIWSRLTAEPDIRRSTRIRPQDLDYSKRAGSESLV